MPLILAADRELTTLPRLSSVYSRRSLGSYDLQYGHHYFSTHPQSLSTRRPTHIPVGTVSVRTFPFSSLCHVKAHGRHAYRGTGDESHGLRNKKDLGST